jgi:hypothetical protein
MVYRLIKEEIFDGEDYEYMPGWSLQIPRSGSVQIRIKTSKMFCQIRQDA